MKHDGALSYSQKPDSYSKIYFKQYVNFVRRERFLLVKKVVHGCTNPRCQVIMVTKFSVVVPNIWVGPLYGTCFMPLSGA
jgi:hypothetical protein